MKGPTTMHEATKKQIDKVKEDHIQDKETKEEEKAQFTHIHHFLSILKGTNWTSDFKIEVFKKLLINMPFAKALV